MFHLKRFTWFLIAAGLLALPACGGGAGAAPTIDPGAIYTAAVETAYVQLTQTAMAATETPMQPVATNTPVSTNTPLITDTPPGSIATNTPFSLTPIRTSVDNCDSFQFIADITIPDGTELAPGEVFEKTWRIQNTGVCTWDDGYLLIPGWGDTDKMSSPYQVLIKSEVYPGDFLDISITLVAPVQTGEYTGYWRMQNDRGSNFGIALTTVIRVNGTPAP